MMRPTTTKTRPPQPRKTTSCGKGACGKPWHTSANNPQESRGTRDSTMARPSELWELSGIFNTEPKCPGQIRENTSASLVEYISRRRRRTPYNDLFRRRGMRDARIKGPPVAELPSRARHQLRNNRQGVRRDPNDADHNRPYKAMVAPNYLPCARRPTAAHTYPEAAGMPCSTRGQCTCALRA